MNKSDLSAVEKIAIAGCVKDTEIDGLKASLPDGFSDSVSFDVHFEGNVQKGLGTPSATAEVSATVSLVSLPIFCEVLRNCGIGESRLRRALNEIDPAKVSVNDKLSNVFAKIAREKASKLPNVTRVIPGKRGSVQSQVTAKKI